MRILNKIYSRSVLIYIIVSFSIVFSGEAFSQDVQAWLDGFIIKRIGKQIDFETNIGYNKLLKEDGWSDKYVCGTLSWQPAGWYSVEGSAEYHITEDPLAYDIREFRYFVGQKFIFVRYIKALRLDQPYFYARFEHRFLDYPADGTSEENMRMRFRLGSRVILNNTSVVPKTWYVPFYFESFINLNGEATERYSSRNRFVVGAGYALNSRWRFELVHYGQRSRHNMEDRFVRTDIMLQLKVMYYF